MAPIYLFGIGFEAGSTSQGGTVTGAGVTSDTTPVHTGSRSIYITGTGGSSVNPSSHTFPVPTTPNEMYISIWTYCTSAGASSESPALRFLTSDAKIEIRRDGSGNWDVYRDTTLIANGGIVWAPGGWHLLEVHVLIHDTTGILQTKVDGVLDVDFEGDTKGGSATTIESIQMWGRNINGSWNYDDFTMATDDWIGDVRYDRVLADGDDSVQWTRSAEASNYLTIDEVPPSDSDYNTADADTEKDVYTLADWTGAGKSPEIVTQWCRAQKDEASAHQLELIFDDGTESIDSPFDISTTYFYYSRMSATKPSSGAWDETAIDALKIGMRAQLV